jgi:hypothetical protein
LLKIQIARADSDEAQELQDEIDEVNEEQGDEGATAGFDRGDPQGDN